MGAGRMISERERLSMTDVAREKADDLGDYSEYTTWRELELMPYLRRASHLGLDRHLAGGRGGVPSLAYIRGVRRAVKEKE